MRQETQIIKANIKRDFPQAMLSLKYIKAANYVFSSDKIKIKTNIPYYSLGAYLAKNTIGIAIYPKGSFASKYGDFNTSIFGIDSEVEFIEIESTDKIKHGS